MSESENSSEDERQSIQFVPANLQVSDNQEATARKLICSARFTRSSSLQLVNGSYQQNTATVLLWTSNNIVHCARHFFLAVGEVQLKVAATVLLWTSNNTAHWARYFFFIVGIASTVLLWTSNNIVHQSFKERVYNLLGKKKKKG
ncbi:hypothetical protein OUZ56_032091 [Daphnia magna]|uniref:Uncharacterized protein n=1 Tax=Daphnia magna TaxID=35525 RepID=A0ABQ9ZX73_9CRUS|nr:hypothetical protein OUZ56_032091 [Daphnia magna]